MDALHVFLDDKTVSILFKLGFPSNIIPTCGEHNRIQTSFHSKLDIRK